MRWWYFIEPVLQFTSKSDESYHLREKCFQNSNSHSQTKRPEPSDGFLKYLEDEVSGRIADMEHPQCAEAIWYGATTEKEEQWKDTTKFKIWKMFCCLKQQSQNLLVQLCPPVFPFWQKNRQEGPGINLNVWAQTRLGFRIFTITLKNYKRQSTTSVRISFLAWIDKVKICFTAAWKTHQTNHRRRIRQCYLQLYIMK